MKKAVEDLTKQGIHLRGGKARIQELLARHNVQVTNIPALAETLFRTRSQQAYAAGRWNTVNDSDFGDYIWGFEYVTAGDDRVREGHRVLEGVRLPKEDPFWKKYFPPNGWNCRCTTLEIWKDEPTAKIDFGITGRDPRKRTPGAMNVPSEFRGNVGIFAAATPKKSEKKKPAPVREVAKKISTRIVPENKTSNQSRDSGKMAPDKRLQEEIRKVIQVLAARYGSEVMLHLQLIPSGNTCRVLWNGTLIETIKVLEGNDTHFSFSNESKRKYKIKGKKPFSTLLGAVSGIMESTKTDNVVEAKEETETVESEEILELSDSMLEDFKTGVSSSTYQPELYSLTEPPEELKKLFKKKKKENKPHEIEIFSYLINTGNEVEPEKEYQERHYDAKVNNEKVEFKSLSGNSINTADNRIVKAVTQGCTRLILDARHCQLKMNQALADEIVRNAIDIVRKKVKIELKIHIEICAINQVDGRNVLKKYIYAHKEK